MTKIAINGFGRIGMLAARIILAQYPQLRIAAINDLRKPAELKKTFANDSVYGKFNKPLTGVLFFQEKDPAKLPWQKIGIALVLECAGFFTEWAGASKHLQAGAKKVIISAPSQSVNVPVYLLGVNQAKYQVKKDHIISMGSCTTNAVAPVAKVLDSNFGIKRGFINTIHSYTATQDKIYPDWRISRAAELSIVPATTGATKTVEKALPELKGKLQGLALRVPTATVSIVDFVCQVSKPASRQKVKVILKTASQTKDLKGILRVGERPLMSADYKASPYSAIVDSNLIQTAGDLIKVLIWYDNEWGYARRLSQMTNFVAKQL